jgi:WD40 repeat protein
MAGGRTLLALGGTTSLQTGDVEIHLWNTYEKRQVLSFGKESNHAVCMVFSKDNDLLFSSHRDDQCIKVWSVKTGVLLFKQRQENLVTRLIRSDDRLYLAGCTQQPASQILIWEMPKIKP